MGASGAFLVPTLQVINQATSADSDAITPRQREELRTAFVNMQTAVRLAKEAGVSIGSGSDIVGPRQSNRGRELLLKAELIGNHHALQSATRVNAELFGLADRIGTVEVGKEADLILVRGQPLDDITPVADTQRVPIVIKGGIVVKDAETRTKLR